MPGSASAPQRDWAVNNPAELPGILAILEGIADRFNGTQTGGKRVSLADVIVLGGCAAVEQAARRAGHDVEVPFAPGRTDAVQDQTDVESFAVLEPTADGFRNHVGEGHLRSAEELLVDRAQMLTLSAPEMTALVGGMRALNANSDRSGLVGVLTTRPGMLTNDFFVNLLDMDTEWEAASGAEETFEGRDRATGELRWTASRADLVFGSNSQLRAIAEVYASDDDAGEVRPRLRGRLGQGDEPGPVRPRLIRGERRGAGRTSPPARLWLVTRNSTVRSRADRRIARPVGGALGPSSGSGRWEARGWPDRTGARADAARSV